MYSAGLTEPRWLPKQSSHHPHVSVELILIRHYHAWDIVIMHRPFVETDDTWAAQLERIAPPRAKLKIKIRLTHFSHNGAYCFDLQFFGQILRRQFVQGAALARRNTELKGLTPIAADPFFWEEERRHTREGHMCTAWQITPYGSSHNSENYTREGNAQLFEL